jgi:hypothetical protein
LVSIDCCKPTTFNAISSPDNINGLLVIFRFGSVLVNPDCDSGSESDREESLERSGG